VGLISYVSFGDERIPKEASFADMEIDDGARLGVDCDDAAYTPAEAVTKLGGRRGAALKRHGPFSGEMALKGGGFLTQAALLRKPCQSGCRRQWQLGLN